MVSKMQNKCQYGPKCTRTMVSPGFIRLSVQAGRQLLRQVVALCGKVGGMKDEVLHRKAGDVVYVMCI
jgi:hypothetical protein